MKQKYRDTVERNPRCDRSPIECEDLFTIEEPAYLFDLSVETLIDEFKDALIREGADESWSNDYDDFGIFHAKAKRAIQSVLDHSNPRIKHCSVPDVVVENIGPQAEIHYETWEDAAEAWIVQWIKLYNLILKGKTETYVDQIQTAIEDAKENDAIEIEDIDAVVSSTIDSLEHYEYLLE